ncbi:hypothetical protein [Gulosibacter sp. 10]|uniref:hypothetical protein n=1 Tax=Gulosibacter sp. 10 TaxID=1255570 RepID=UPI00111FA836|nr:hypothetical protein [Gulosibacter sp. 10]
MSERPQNAASIDVTPLSLHVSNDDIEARFGRDAGEDPAVAAHVESRRSMFRTVAVVGTILVAIGVAIIAVDAMTGLDGTAWGGSLAVIGGLPAAIAGTLALRRMSPATAYRIARFAEANGLSFRRWKAGAGYTGMPFAYGHGHSRFLVLNGRRKGLPVEFGNLSFSEGAGRHVWRRCGYVAIGLPGALPHMILDARHSQALLGLTLPNPPHKDHRVDVGSGRSFALVAAEGAEPIARALFTPEVVERFARLAKRFDMEIRGDRLFLYSRRDVSTGSADRWRETMGMVDDVAGSVSTWPVWPMVRGMRGVADHPPMRTGRVRKYLLPTIIGVVLFALLLWYGLTGGDVGA